MSFPEKNISCLTLWDNVGLSLRPVGLLPLLPQEFTRDDVRALRIAQGMKPDPKEVLKKWVARGQVVKDEQRGIYIRCEGTGTGDN